MAKKAPVDESKSGYFRRLFEEHPEWLDTKSNDAIVERWKDDHPGQDMTVQYRQSMANVKSIMRKKLGKRRRRRRRDKDGVAVAVAGGAIRSVSSHSLD